MSGRKTDLGISVYPRPGDDVCRKEIEDYISQAARLGYRKVFSSLHLPEDDIDALAGNVLWLSEVVHGSGMELILDLSSTELRQLLGRREHVRRLKAAKAAYLRLDYGFTELDIRRVTGDLGIQGFVLNASVLTGEEIGEMVDCIRAHAGSSAAIEACHNFYPRPETGLAIEFMIEKSNLYKPLGIPVAACIASHHRPRGPLREGLPTVEEHRRLDPGRAAAELIATGVIDQVFFGDPFASRAELEAVRGVAESPALRLRIRLDPECSEQERRIALGRVHRARPDQSAYLIRSQSSREMASPGEKVRPRPARRREAYCATIDNELYLRYSGELHIVLRDLPADERVNVIGRIVPGDTGLVRYVLPGSEFILEEA